MLSTEDANRCCAVHLATKQREEGRPGSRCDCRGSRKSGVSRGLLGGRWGNDSGTDVCHRKDPRPLGQVMAGHHKGVIYNEEDPLHQGSQGTVMISDRSREPGRVPLQGEGDPCPLPQHLSWVLARGRSTPTPSHSPSRPSLPQPPGSGLYGLPVSSSWVRGCLPLRPGVESPEYGWCLPAAAAGGSTGKT